MCSSDLPGFGQGLQHQDVAIPQPRGREVLVKVCACGLCHTDVHLKHGYFDIGNDRKFEFAGIDCPVTLGHEISGSIAACGPDADALPDNASVLVYPWIGCGTCEACTTGLDHMCAKPNSLGVYRDGGYAEYVLVPDSRFIIDISGLDPVASAPLACSGLTTYSAIRKFRADITRQPLVIIGAGGLGLMAIGILARLGAPAPVVLDIDPAKRQAALAAGARAAIDPAEADANKQIRKAIGGPILSVLDLVGSGKTVRQAANLLNMGGQVVVIGLLGGELTIPTPLFALKAITIQGSYVGSLAELNELVALAQAKGAPEVLLDRRPMADAPSALDALEAGQIVGRVVLVTDEA